VQYLKELSKYPCTALFSSMHMSSYTAVPICIMFIYHLS